MHRFTAICLSILVAGCGAAEPDASVSTSDAVVEATPIPDWTATPDPIADVTEVPIPPFSAAGVDKALKALKAERWVKRVEYRDGKMPQWLIQVKGKGQPEFGLGEVACMIIGESGARGKPSYVGLVDQAIYARTNDTSASSLGQVDCNTSAHLPW